MWFLCQNSTRKRLYHTSRGLPPSPIFNHLNEIHELAYLKGSGGVAIAFFVRFFRLTTIMRGNSEVFSTPTAPVYTGPCRVGGREVNMWIICHDTSAWWSSSYYSCKQATPWLGGLHEPCDVHSRRIFFWIRFSFFPPENLEFGRYSRQRTRKYLVLYRR